MMTDYTSSPSSPAGLLLPGLDGSNPLGFLAALGVLRVIAGAPGTQHARISWTPHGGVWVPAISASPATLDETALLDILEDNLTTDIAEHPARLLAALADDAKDGDRGHLQVFSNLLKDADAANRVSIDWLAAIASDAASPDATNQLQTSRRDYFYGNLTSVMAACTREHLHRAIFRQWDYGDPLQNQSLHLDPSEDRRHAHQWNQPSGDPERNRSGGMLGANRMAIEAIPVFTSIPEGEKLRTIGFTGTRAANTRWTWPVWSVPLGLRAVQSLLTLPDLQAEVVDERCWRNLRQRGVMSVFRSRRILVGKTPNFTPAQCIG